MGNGTTANMSWLLRGSLLFPVIFNIYVANNAKILTSGIGQILSFAEEVLSYPIGSNIEKMVTDINRKFDKMSYCCKIPKQRQSLGMLQSCVGF